MRLTISIPFAAALALSTPALAMDDTAALALMESLYDSRSTIEQDGSYGRIGDSDVWYGTVCESTSSGTLFLIKASNPSAPDVFRLDGLCQRGVSWRDIDGDGIEEIRTTSWGGGSGVLQSNATFYRWDDGASAPTEIVSFLESRYSSWDGAYNRFGFEPPQWEPFTTHTDSFLPVGALCPSESECELITSKLFCIGECDSPVPANYLTAPGWDAFVATLAAEGFEPGNVTADAQPPAVTEDRQAAFDAWLSE